jgi:phosphatidylcholine synthase
MADTDHSNVTLERTSEGATTKQAVAAWAVHVYTCLGGVVGLLAIDAVVRESYGAAFTWMAVAMFVDCTDGVLARRARVKTVLPWFDGARLDDIIDYLNYVFVPVFFLYQAKGMLPEADHWRLCISALPLLASGYGFCQADAKTPDHSFKGFPSYWNVVALYLYCLQTSEWFNVIVIGVLSVLVFVPVHYLYPSRSSSLRVATNMLGIVWALVVLVLISQFPHPSRKLAVLSLFFPAYYFAASLYVHLDKRSTAGTDLGDSAD